MPWLRLRLASNAEQADGIAQSLQEAGALAVSLLPEDSCPDSILEPAPGQTALWRRVRLQALLPPDAKLDALPHLVFEVDFLADEDWSQTWRQGFAPTRFGRLVVAHKAHRLPRNDDVLLRIDPGLAFGSGTHPTTALCLEWLSAHALEGKRLLDVGAGSGILAIAARLLGADFALAVDRDPQARWASCDNARENGVEIGIAAELEEVRGHFDIVLANIVADTLCDMAPALCRRGDVLVLSGILPAQAERVQAAFRQADPTFEFLAPIVKDGWVLLSGQRRV